MVEDIELRDGYFLIVSISNLLGIYVAKEYKKYIHGDFPGGTVVKNPPANAGDTGSSPGPERSHMPQCN